MSRELAVVVPAFNEPGIVGTLNSLYNQNRRTGVHHYVVDNGSTDNTRNHIEAFARRYEDFPLDVLDEEEKGTGAASDTGFTRAINNGYKLIARTDADTEPANNWTQRIVRDYRCANLQLLGGSVRPLHDEYYRTGDEILLPTAIRAARMALAVKNHNLDYLKAVIGSNMATRASAYVQVGGFARTSIDHLDEDIDLSLRMASTFGSGVISLDPMLRVETSMRRIRDYGIAGTAIHHLFPGVREYRNREIDVR